MSPRHQLPDVHSQAKHAKLLMCIGTESCQRWQSNQEQGGPHQKGGILEVARALDPEVQQLGCAGSQSEECSVTGSYVAVYSSCSPADLPKASAVIARQS